MEGGIIDAVRNDFFNGSHRQKKKPPLVCFETKFFCFAASLPVCQSAACSKIGLFSPLSVYRVCP